MASPNSALEPAWIVTCTCGWKACGWNTGGNTLDEILTAVRAHEVNSVQGTLHSLAITDRLQPPTSSEVPKRLG